MDDLSRFCCQTASCAASGKRGVGNLTVCMRYGKDKRLRLWYCRLCPARFSERKGPPRFPARLPAAKVESVLAHIVEGGGVRKPGHRVGVTRETVARYAVLAGTHAHALHDELVAVSPQTREGQFDEQGAFGGKKEQHCDPEEPADAKPGDTWDPVAWDPEPRLVVSVVPGKRSAETVEKVVQACKARTGGQPMTLIPSDDYPAYQAALLNAYGTEGVPPRTGKPGRPQAPSKVAPPELQYATVPKTREKGRVVKVDFRVVFGTVLGVMAALAQSVVSTALNPAFVERHNGTERHRKARKVRQSYWFSKNWEGHEALTYFTVYRSNFCWPVRTLRVRDAEGHWQQCTPAMAAGLSDHIWTLFEWLTFPGVQRK